MTFRMANASFCSAHVYFHLIFSFSLGTFCWGECMRRCDIQLYGRIRPYFKLTTNFNLNKFQIYHSACLPVFFHDCWLNASQLIIESKSFHFSLAFLSTTFSSAISIFSHWHTTLVPMALDFEMWCIPQWTFFSACQPGSFCPKPFPNDYCNLMVLHCWPIPFRFCCYCNSAKKNNIGQKIK